MYMKPTLPLAGVLCPIHAPAHSNAFLSMHIGSDPGVAGESGMQVQPLRPSRKVRILPSAPIATMVASFATAAGAARWALAINWASLGALVFAAVVCVVAAMAIARAMTPYRPIEPVVFISASGTIGIERPVASPHDDVRRRPGRSLYSAWGDWAGWTDPGARCRGEARFPPQRYGVGLPSAGVSRIYAQRSCKTRRSISATERTPHNTIVKSSSRRINSRVIETPAPPSAPRPYTYARPIITARAPNAIAFSTSWPERTPPSIHTSQSRPTRDAISGNTLIDDGAPSS